MKPGNKKQTNSTSKQRFVMVLRFLVPVAIIAAGAVYASHLVSTSPQSERKPPERQARLVEVVTVERTDVPVVIAAMGTVVPARMVDLKAQVPGKIVEMDPDLMPGGLFEAGRTLMKIEPDDYELAVRQQENEYVTAQSALRLEHGNQAVAEQEYKLLEDVVSTDDMELVLRKPQLAIAESVVQTAEARLRQAKLDLERTCIISPFNAAVTAKYVDLGAMVSSSTAVVTLTGTDEYWIEARVPLDQLKWIRIPGHNGNLGSSVRVFNPAAWGQDEHRSGQVIRLCPDLEEAGRMAKLLISVKDPLLLTENQSHKSTLLLSSYVQVEIEGVTIKSAFMLDSTLRRDGDNIWLFGNDGKLEIRPVKVVYRGSEHVVIADGISEGERIVKTDIAAPVNGMPLALYSDPADQGLGTDTRLKVSKEGDLRSSDSSGATQQ